MQEVEPAPALEMLQDGPRISTPDVEEVNFTPPRLTYIAKGASPDEKATLIALLQECMDIFA